MGQPQSESQTSRSGTGWIVGSAILVVLHGFLSMLRDRTAAITAAYTIGTFVGGAVMSALIGLIIYGVVRAIGKTRPASTAAKIVFWVLLVLLILNVANFVGRAVNPRSASAQAAFTKEDRQGLRVDADSIRHVGLGFVLPHPGTTFIASPDAESLLAGQFGGRLPPDLVNWVFRDTTRGRLLIIQVIAAPGLNEQKFSEAARGLRKSVAKFKALSDTTVWAGPQSESRYVMQLPNGLYFVTRCVPSLKPRREYVVCFQAYSDEPTALTAVGKGLKVRNDR
jgi:hypothetical protein